MMRPPEQDDPLAAFFAAARAAEPPASPRLVAAVLADAAAAARARRRHAVGWGAALAASVALGFWTGLAGPATLAEGPALVRAGDPLAEAEPAVSSLFDGAIEEGA